MLFAPKPISLGTLHGGGSSNQHSRPATTTENHSTVLSGGAGVRVTSRPSWIPSATGQVKGYKNGWGREP